MHHRPIHPAWGESPPVVAYERPSRRHLEVDLDEFEAHEEVSRDLIVRERRLGAALGAVGGAIGGALMLLVSRTLLASQHAAFDPAVRFGEKVGRWIPDVPPEALGLAMSVVIGAAVGALLGRFTWRVRRLIPRVLFFSILLPTAWIAVHVVLVGHMDRAQIAAVPFSPFLVGSLLYGLCVASLPITRRSRVTEILPEKH
jgi:hypothetical protein